jgi:hypothetical protein
MRKLLIVSLLLLALPLAAAPAPTPEATYICTCEVVDPCDPFTFIMLGRVCEVGQGCQCSIQTGRNGCMTSFSIQCTGSSES